jgi:hypothetical protein
LPKKQEKEMKFETIGLCELKFRVDVAINHKFETDRLETLRLAIEKAINENANHSMVMGESMIELLEVKK